MAPTCEELLSGVAPGEPVAVVLTDDGLALATASGTATCPGGAAGSAAFLVDADARCAPRWVWWSARSAVNPVLSAAPATRLRRCWDLAAVHRVLHGGSADDPARVVAAWRGLAESGIPRAGQLDLLSASGSAGDDEGRPGDPLRPDGHLRADWADGAWARSLDSATRWAALALRVQRGQQAVLDGLAPDGPQPDSSQPDASGRRGDTVHTAWSESAAELLCVELASTGLPLDVRSAEEVIGRFAGPRPRDAVEAGRLRAARDAPVLACVPGRSSLDLRSPAQVKELLTDVGLDVPDTRSWRLERLRTAHPVVDALLTWRQGERFVSTYGYRWLGEHVGPDGRLRGTWSGSDGGAGRMTAQAGLHSMPRELRVAVRAEPGTVLVRADLGQVEPRVLAAVSGDAALAQAAREDDLYAPVARRLGCERAVAKVAVLAAMYGQTSGAAGEALAGMNASYPVAMSYLARAHEAGQRGRHLRTYGGRLVRVWPVEEVAPEAGEAASRAYRGALAARGRFTRNAVVQGAAAELFKAWSATVRARLAADSCGEVVLCLHDELLLQVRADRGQEVAAGIVDDLEATAARWSRGSGVRFVADVSVVQRWSDAKE